jgi:D-aminoacyl-tRNA deacylase
MGTLEWDTYRTIRKMAEAVSPGTRCYIHALEGTGTPELIQVNPVLLAETVKSDEPGFIKLLGSLPLVHLSTHDNCLLPEFITYTHHSPKIINDLNTLCVKIIRSKEITVTERDNLIITKVRFDPHKARELGVLPGPSYRELAGGRPVITDDRTITPEMVSSRSEIRIHIPGLEKFS